MKEACRHSKLNTVTHFSQL